MAKGDRDGEIRIGRYVAVDPEGTPAPWNGNLKTGKTAKLIRQAVRILNGEPQEQPAQETGQA